MAKIDVGMRDNKKNAFKAGIWYMISSILVKSISIISTPIFTRAMSKADYGIAATFSTWYSLLFIICSLNAGYSIGRAKIDFGEKFEEYIASLRVLCIIVTGTIGVVILSFWSFFEKVIGLDLVSVFLLLIYLVSGTAISLEQGRYRFRYLYKENIGISLYTAISTVVVSVFLVLIMTDKAYLGKILGTVIPAALLNIWIWICSFRRKEVCIRKEYFRYALAMSLPLIVHSLSVYVLGQSDRLMIKYFCGDDAVGLYSLVYQYAVLIHLFTTAINQAWNPWFHDTYHEKEYDLIRRNVKKLMLFGCYIGLGCIAVAPEAIAILGGKEYEEGIVAVAPIALGIVIEFIYTQYVIIEMHLKKMKYISVATSIAAVTNLVTNAFFIPRFGYLAAAYTTLFCYGLLLLTHFAVTRFVLKIHLYDDWITALLLVGTCLAGYGFTAIYSQVIIRYALIVVLSLLMLYTNKDIVAIKMRKRLRK